MLEFSAALTIRRPIGDVFAWLTDAENQGMFDKGSVKMTLLTPGPWRAGSQFREVRSMGGRRITALSEVAEAGQRHREWQALPPSSYWRWLTMPQHPIDRSRSIHTDPALATALTCRCRAQRLPAWGCRDQPERSRPPAARSGIHLRNHHKRCRNQRCGNHSHQAAIGGG
jgi:hypothetical protein